MRLLIRATLLTVALATGASPALATAIAGPRFGVYTANVALGGGGHLEASISVLDPPSKVAGTFDCANPPVKTRDRRLEYASNSLARRVLQLQVTASLAKITTLTENNSLVKRGSYKTSVDVNGAFTSRGQFVGTVLLGARRAIARTTQQAGSLARYPRDRAASNDSRREQLPLAAA